MPYTRFIALGDSLSADLYPAKAAAGDTDPASRHEALRPGLGAAALLYRNADGYWPAHRGRDLATRYPGMRFENAHRLDHPAAHPSDHHATAGSTTVSVLAYQLTRVETTADPVLVTLTVGRDDALRMLGAPRPPATLVATMSERLARVLAAIDARLPNADLLLTTVVDPTDGTGRLADDTDVAREVGWLEDYNGEVRRLAADRPRVRLADAHRHFLGHGLTTRPDEQWIWAPSPFELNDRGASELRRVWWKAMPGFGTDDGAPARAPV